MRHRLLPWLAVAAMMPMLGQARVDAGYDVGVYYFPGWKETPSAWWNPPWDKIKPYPEREPLLGWYEEGRDDVIEKQLSWMNEYSIDFVIFDWYWNPGEGISLTQAIDAYLRSPARTEVSFSILWANHSRTPSSMDEFDRIVDYWVTQYFGSDSYKRIDGKPVLFVFSPQMLDRDAKAFGATAGELLARARERARAAGLPGIFIVGSAEANERQVTRVLPDAGYDALSAYNYHLAGGVEPPRLSRSYDELVAGYQQTWTWIVGRSPLPYFVPVTSGWDKRPWGGSKEPEHDNSVSNPKTFGMQLERARALIDRHPDKTRKTAVICCWNEYGEGSYVEPTKKFGFEYLAEIKRVFGTADQ